MVKNYMEDVVEDKLSTVMQEYPGICKCQKCIEDIMAISLNNLKPAYTSTQVGDTYCKINQLKLQLDTDVTTEIARAIEIVAKNPRHDI